jgi:hypothetical protein
MNRSLMQSARIAILVALALLFAQWVGLTHRISHAQLQAQEYSAVTPSADDSGDNTDGSARHSCAAFDAATVGDLVHIAPFIAPLLASAQVLALWAAFISWDAPLTRYFSSRAPPLF